MNNPNRQTRLMVYGDGPFDDELGHPCGHQDAGVFVMNPAFVVVRVEWLNALEELAELQAAHIRKLRALL